MSARRSQDSATALQLASEATDLAYAIQDEQPAVAALIARLANVIEQFAAPHECASVMRDTIPPGRFRCKLPFGHPMPHIALLPSKLELDPGAGMWTDDGAAVSLPGDEQP